MKGSAPFAMLKKKNLFQKHRETEGERKKREEAEAARLYDEFVESFKADDDAPSSVKTFIRGGTVMPGTSSEEATRSAPPTKKPGKYVPSFIPPSMAEAQLSKDRMFDTAMEESVFQYPPRKIERDKPRKIDQVLVDIKREQEAREERQKARREGRPSLFDFPPDENMGSFDDGDPYTTNLYVGNIAPEVDEEILKKEFGRFGPIASVKIMWPRDDDQKKRGRNCGFVAFMRRDDADKAMAHLNGIILHDQELKIGWGKSVPLPPQPIYPAPSGTAMPGTVPKGATVPPPGVQAPLPWQAPREITPDVEAGVGPDIEVKIPEDGRLRFIIDTMALYVLKDGCAFEQLIMELEQRNPEYAFLFDLQSPEHVYYRWRVFSLSQGDTLKTWQIEPFVMVEGGQRWVPPSMTSAELTRSTAAQKGGSDGRDRDRALSDLERDRFEDMLRFLTVERTDICNAMVFALDNADAAGEVVEILLQALTLAETAVPLKVARLFLVSDILHNSTAPVRNASRYRSKLEAALPQIFESLQETYKGVESRMTQEALRRHVLRVLRLWRERYVFGDDYLNGLQAVFLHGPSAAGPDANPRLAEELADLPDEDIERKCRQSGLSSKGTRTEMIGRLMTLDHYLHAESRTLSNIPPSSSILMPNVTGPLLPPEAYQTHLLQPPRDTDSGSDSEMAAARMHVLPGPAGPPPDLATTSAPVVVPSSRWTTIDEEEEKQSLPQVPISKWLLQEQQEQQRQQQQLLLQQQQLAIAASIAQQAAALSDDSGGIFGHEGDTPLRGGDGTPEHEVSRPSEPLYPDPSLSAGVSGDGAVGAGGAIPGVGLQSESRDESRRQRLRQVELACAQLADTLEEDGASREEVKAAVEQKRAALMAELEKEEAERAAEALERWRNRRSEKIGKDEDRERSRKDRSNERDRKDRDRDRERDRKEKDKDRERESERDRDRSGKSKDREKEREKEKEKEKDRDRRDTREREPRESRDSMSSQSKARESGHKRDRSTNGSPHTSPRRARRSRSRSPRSKSPVRGKSKHESRRSKSPKKSRK